MYNYTRIIMITLLYVNICRLCIDVNKPEPEYSQPLDGERDEGKCITRYDTYLYYIMYNLRI